MEDVFEASISDEIVKHIVEHGPATVEELCAAINVKPSTICVHVQGPLDDGRLIIEKCRKEGSSKRVHRYCLQPEPVSPFGGIDPADPFGIVAKRAAKVIVEKLADLHEKPVEEVAKVIQVEPANPEVATILDHGFEPVEAGQSVVMVPRTPELASPLAQRYRTTPEAEEATSGFLVALLSNSSLELRLDGKTVTLKKSEWTHMREFINKVEVA